MLGDFTYYNPTKLIFGKDAMTALTAELEKYGKTVQLVYGGGSIKKNGIYDQVIAALEAAGKTVVEDAGVMPNPTAQKLREGARIARENDVDFILAVAARASLTRRRSPSLRTCPRARIPGMSTTLAPRSPRRIWTSCPWAPSSPWWAPDPR